LSALNSDFEKTTSGNWRKVYYTRRKYNKQPDTKLPQSVLTIMNHFSLPNNPQEESETFNFQVWLGKEQLQEIKINEP